MRPSGRQGLEPRPGAQDALHSGGGPRGAAIDAYVPRMVNLEYKLGEGPNTLLGPAWDVGTREAGVFHESPEGSADPFSDDDGVHQVSQEQACTNHGLQVDQAVTVVEDPMAAVLSPTRAERWGLCMGGLEPRPPACHAEQGAGWR